MSIFYSDQFNCWHNKKHEFWAIYLTYQNFFCLLEIWKFIFIKYLPLGPCFEPLRDISISSFVHLWAASNRPLRATCTKTAAPTWFAAANWTLLLDERSFSSKNRQQSMSSFYSIFSKYWPTTYQFVEIASIKNFYNIFFNWYHVHLISTWKKFSILKISPVSCSSFLAENLLRLCWLFMKLILKCTFQYYFLKEDILWNFFSKFFKGRNLFL